MSSKKIVAIAGSVIAAGCYFIVLFLIGGLTGASLISSVFTLAALGLCIGGAYVYLEEPVVEQYFYIFPGAYIGMLYLAVQMVVSLVIAGLHPAIVAQLIVEFVILGIFGSLQCYALYAGLRARDLKRRLQAKVSSMRALSAKATAICKNTGDYKWKKQVQKVADAIRYADPVSRGDTRQAEQQIDEALEQIRIAVRTENQKEFDEAAERIRKSLEVRG